MYGLKSYSNYFKNFSVLSFILIAIFTSILFFWQTNSTKQTLLIIAENQTIHLGHQLAHIISEEFIKPHIAANDDINMNDPATLGKLDKLIQLHLESQNVIRVVLYDSDSIITYSTLHKIIGIDASKNINVQNAINGKKSSHVVYNVNFDDFDPGSSGLLGKVIETYMPFTFIYRSQKVKGAIEIYNNMDKINADITALNRHFLFIVIIISSFLYIFLFLTILQIEKKRMKTEIGLNQKNLKLNAMNQQLLASE